MKKCAIIYNPNSGKNINIHFLDECSSILSKNGYETIIYQTKYKRHAIEIVENLKEIDLLISFGGDGTFNEVVTGNLKREKPLLLTHIPIGTTNDIGSMFGYGKDIIENLKITLSGEIRGIDICTINKQPFVYASGFGKFMNIPYETPRKKKMFWGYIAYLFEGLKNFINPTPLYKLTIDVNGKKYTGNYSFTLISNATRIAGFNNFHKDIKLDDNQFEVAFCKSTTKRQIIKSMFYVSTGNLEKATDFEFYKCSKLTVTFIENVIPWCIDGEKLNDNSKTYNIEIINDIKILIPKKNINKLFVSNKK